MNTAGKQCSICHGKVVFEAEGTGCAACDKIWHRECLDDPGSCPQCAAALSNETAGLLRPGKAPQGASAVHLSRESQTGALLPADHSGGDAAPLRVNVNMQRCGKPCMKCGTRVLIQSESSGCPACGLVWHLDCHSPANLCPACGKDVESISIKAESEREQAVKDRQSRGKTYYWIMLLIRTMGACLGLLAAWSSLEKSSDGHWDIWMEILSWLMYLFVWILAYLGVRGARVFLGVAAFLGVILVAGSSSLDAIPVLAIAANCFSVWACFFSRDVKFYEASFR